MHKTPRSLKNGRIGWRSTSRQLSRLAIARHGSASRGFARLTSPGLSEGPNKENSETERHHTDHFLFVEEVGLPYLWDAANCLLGEGARGPHPPAMQKNPTDVSVTHLQMSK